MPLSAHHPKISCFINTFKYIYYSVQFVRNVSFKKFQVYFEPLCGTVNRGDFGQRATLDIFQHLCIVSVQSIVYVQRLDPWVTRRTLSYLTCWWLGIKLAYIKYKKLCLQINRPYAIVRKWLTEQFRTKCFVKIAATLTFDIYLFDKNMKKMLHIRRETRVSREWGINSKWKFHTRLIQLYHRTITRFELGPLIQVGTFFF